MKNGGDPNQKMTDWFDSSPCGWAASFGRVDALISLMLAGGDPFEYNKSGNNAMNDAQREKYQNVINFLNQYTKMKQAAAPVVAAPVKAVLNEKEIIERYLKGEAEKKAREEQKRIAEA